MNVSNTFEEDKDENNDLAKREPPVIEVMYDDREQVLSKLNKCIDYLEKKALTGRVQDPRAEKIKIQYFKTLAYFCSVYNQIKKDVELENLNQEMKALAREIERLNGGD